MHWLKRSIGLYKTEVIKRRSPWRGLKDVEFATLEWVDWFNNRRLLEKNRVHTAGGLEETYYGNQKPLVMVAGLK
jgi:transposase InsO family protein